MRGEDHERLAATALILKRDGTAAAHFERAADAYWLEGNTKRAGLCVRLWAALAELGGVPESAYRGREAPTEPPPPTRKAGCVKCGETRPSYRNGRCMGVPASEHDWRE
jgi:hypothetical protein